jgi:hypothetical protein
VSRFILIATVAGACPGDAYRTYPRGTTICDTAGNAQPGDRVWPALCNCANDTNMRPLDASALALMPGSTIITLAQLASSPIGGP